MNPTAEKFGYPGTLIKEYDHWLVLARPQQVTLGSLVLVCKDPVTRFSEISGAAFTELHSAIVAIETTTATGSRSVAEAGRSRTRT